MNVHEPPNPAALHLYAYSAHSLLTGEPLWYSCASKWPFLVTCV